MVDEVNKVEEAGRPARFTN